MYSHCAGLDSAKCSPFNDPPPPPLIKSSFYVFATATNFSG